MIISVKSGQEIDNLTKIALYHVFDDDNSDVFITYSPEAGMIQIETVPMGSRDSLLTEQELRKAAEKVDWSGK